VCSCSGGETSGSSTGNSSPNPGYAFSARFFKYAAIELIEDFLHGALHARYLPHLLQQRAEDHLPAEWLTGAVFETTVKPAVHFWINAVALQLRSVSEGSEQLQTAVRVLQTVVSRWNAARASGATCGDVTAEKAERREKSLASEDSAALLQAPVSQSPGARPAPAQPQKGDAPLKPKAAAVVRSSGDNPSSKQSSSKSNDLVNKKGKINVNCSRHALTLCTSTFFRCPVH
jgi:hypothetical protein